MSAPLSDFDETLQKLAAQFESQGYHFVLYVRAPDNEVMLSECDANDLQSIMEMSIDEEPATALNWLTAFGAVEQRVIEATLTAHGYEHPNGELVGLVSESEYNPFPEDSPYQIANLQWFSTETFQQDIHRPGVLIVEDEIYVHEYQPEMLRFTEMTTPHSFLFDSLSLDKKARLYLDEAGNWQVAVFPV